MELSRENLTSCFIFHKEKGNVSVTIIKEYAIVQHPVLFPCVPYKTGIKNSRAEIWRLNIHSLPNTSRWQQF